MRDSSSTDLENADRVVDALPPRTLQDRAFAVLRIGAMIALAAYLVSQFLSGSAPMEAGAKAPLLNLRSYDGVVWNLERFEGQPVLVNFWGSWCPPCVSELPDLVKAANTYEGDVVFVGAAVTSPPQDVIAMVNRFQIPYPVAATDRPSTGRWHADRFPSTYLLDKDHKLVWSTQGAVSERTLRNVFEKHLGLPPL